MQNSTTVYPTVEKFLSQVMENMRLGMHQKNCEFFTDGQWSQIPTVENYRGGAIK